MRRSLTIRLVAIVVLSQLLLAAGLVWAGIIFTRGQLRRAFDSELRGRMMSVAALVRYPEASGAPLVFDASLLPPARSRRHPAFYQVRSRSGAIVASSFPSDVTLPAPSGEGQRLWQFTYNGVAYRGIVTADLPVLDTEEPQPMPRQRLTVYYAAPPFDMDEEVAAAGFAIGGTSLVLLGLAALFTGLAVRRELDPLRELARQAAGISPHNWDFSPGPRTAATTELLPLIQALNLMLERLHHSYQQQRDFMADAAHHLKTPVAILKSSLQSLLQRPRDAAEYESSAQASLLDVERLEQLLQRMLRLARIEQAADDDRPRRAPEVELEANCQAAIERVGPLARSRQVEVRSSGEFSRVSADGDDLELVWLNLLENAVQHSPPGATIELHGELHGTVREIAIRDAGTGITAEDLPHVFDRFRRGRDSRVPGFGLGLAIARSIVRAYGGNIAIESAPGAGTTVRVRLPAAGA
jgi:signal transduction histidine kinase